MVIVTNSILLIYHHTRPANAPTIMEHVHSFEKYSSFSVNAINTANGFPRNLRKFEFAAIVMHYSMFGSLPFLLSESLKRYISASQSKKIFFFQDEMQHVQERFKLLNSLGVDAIFTCLDRKYVNHYLNNTPSKLIKQTLTGYVCDDLVFKCARYYKPFKYRTIDVGYRARNLPYHYGRGAREKSEIAERFIEAVRQTSLTLDISTREGDRIYGDDWYKFVANCKFMLGVMAGTSIFDMTGEVKQKTIDYLREYPTASFQQVEESVLAPYEEIINYRQISPRLFECAASRVCMILFRDDYQGVLTAGRHYIPLEKDFSNIETVLQQMHDQTLVDRIVESSYSELIISDKWRYRKFMVEFDQTLERLGCEPSANSEEHRRVELLFQKDAWLRSIVCWLKSWRSRPFPGRRQLKWLAYKLSIKKA